jgi:NAD-dependent SIR2 family protein deacetylase
VPTLLRARQLDELAQLLLDGDVVVLTGAGLSTESGIPDYRGPTGSLRRSVPMTYQRFVRDPAARHRYWARSHVGWPRLAAARPNAGHRSVQALHRTNHLSGVITQNVDGLHDAAGTVDAVELHGRLARTVCLNCGEYVSRQDVDAMLREANPHFTARLEAVNADGDAELSDTDLGDFRMVPCRVCGDGPLKPDVVFFGETVPRDRVELCYALVESSAALLVLGSSLTVMSGYRFVRHAAALHIPVAIINQGTTRGDQHACLRVDAPLGSTLAALVDSDQLDGVGDRGQHPTGPERETGDLVSRR